MTTAPTMPVAVANSAQVASVATASEPGTCFNAICRLLNRLSRMLARSTRYPISRNSGIDTSASLLSTVKVFCVSR